MAGEATFPFSTFASTSRLLFKLGDEIDQAEKLLYSSSFCDAAVCLSIFYSKALLLFDNSLLWLVHLVWPTHIRPRRAGPTKCRSWSWRDVYLACPSSRMHYRDIPIPFALRAIVMDPYFASNHSCMQIPPFLPLKHRFSRKHTPLNISSLQLVQDPVSLFLNPVHDFERFWNSILCVSNSDFANPFWPFLDFLLRDASISQFGKIFCSQPPCKSDFQIIGFEAMTPFMERFSTNPILIVSVQ